MTDHLTSKQIADYLKNSDHCPYCNSDDWGVGSWNPGVNDVSQANVCHNCGFAWDNVYAFNSIDWSEIQNIDPKHMTKG